MNIHKIQIQDSKIQWMIAITQNNKIVNKVRMNQSKWK